MISVRGLRKSYGSLVAVDGVSFEIQPNETFGLLGPNGAGKTTTIHMMVGLLSPDGGEVHINGASDPTRPAVRRSLGVAPQSLAAYEDLTCQENLMFFGRLYGLHGRRLRGRVDYVLERAGLLDRRSDFVKTLSGGMKQRLQLATAMVHDPQVLFLDEPTVGIDPQARHHILQDIESLRQQGRTVLLTTHYMEEAQRLCDRVAIMDHGHILAIDTVTGIIARYGGHTVVRAEFEKLPPKIPMPARIEDTTVIVETERPFEVAGQLSATGARIRSLAIEQPTLETVFLNLTGRSLRD
jgi:ABC-2 type transport system ATP-binding protein